MDYLVEQRVISVIERSQRILTGVVTVDSTFEELGIDSVDGINLFYDIEEEFQISLSYEEVNFATVREIISGIMLLLIEKNSLHAAKKVMIEEH